MKRFSFLTVLFVAVLAMVMSAPLSAQGMMSGGHQQQMMKSDKDSTMWNNQYSMAQKIDNQSKNLNQNFMQMQNNFKNTMAMNNMSNIKENLEKQQSMMRNMEPMLEQQKDMSNKLMSMVDKRSKNNVATPNEQKMAKNMMDQTRVMNEDFNSLQNHLKDMTNMNKMSDLQPAMKQHYNMMQNMSEMMTAQHDMAGQMMGMMNGKEMGSGMMQKNNLNRSGMQKNGMDPGKTSTDTTKTKSGKW
jgi:hypothetical protein